jgi:hypothetical protein
MNDNQPAEQSSPVPAYLSVSAPSQTPPSLTPHHPSHYRQTPAPVTVSQVYLLRLVADRWDAEVKRCEEARKAQVLEVQLAAHGIVKLT